MNMPISSPNNYTSVKPVVSATKSGEYTDNALVNSPPQTRDLSSYTKVSELKQAERRGDYYTVSDEQLVKAIERAIQAMQGKETNLEFSVHDKTKQIAVKIVDRDSGEVLKEIPPEKSLDYLAKLWEMAGILIDEKR